MLRFFFGCILALVLLVFVYGLVIQIQFSIETHEKEPSNIPFVDACMLQRRIRNRTLSKSLVSC